MKKFVFALFIGALIMAGCEEGALLPDIQQEGQLPLNLTTNITPFTKATDTAFEAYDEVGVSIYIPNLNQLYLGNEKFSILSDGSMQSDREILWYTDTTQFSYVTSYYPYTKDFSYNNELKFSVMTDQSDHSAYTASDLMFACKIMRPTRNTTTLTYHHVLSKIEVNIENKTSETIKDVYINDVYTSTRVQFNVDSAATFNTYLGPTQSIKMCHTTKNNGSDSWEAIVIPQWDVKPTLTILTKSGDKFECVLDSNISFEPETKRIANIVLEETDIHTSFSTKVEDWLPGNGLDFSVIPGAPEVENIFLQASPAGETMTFTININRDWKIYTNNNCDWVVVDQMEGLGKTEVTFTFPANKSKNRSVTFYVKSGEFDYYEISFYQPKMELPIVEGDYNFLKEIVEKDYLGDETPEITDWYTFDGFGFPGINFDVNGEGKWFIQSIDGAPMTGWPTETVLLGIQSIRMRDQQGLAGSELSQIWNTPQLQNINFALCGLTGVYPDEFAANTPNLAEMYMDGNDFYGALPHYWATTKLEVALLANCLNHSYMKENGEYILDENGNRIPKHSSTALTDSPDLGYILPATFDVIMNEDRTFQGDKTQMKLGGVCNGNWLGFEEGWGQARYEKYDKDAIYGNTSIWSPKRLLIGNGDDNSWSWYFSNMGYEGDNYAVCIPQVMLKWNQADADAYTAKCRAARGL